MFILIIKDGISTKFILYHDYLIFTRKELEEGYLESFHTIKLTTPSE